MTTLNLRFAISTKNPKCFIHLVAEGLPKDFIVSIRDKKQYKLPSPSIVSGISYCYSYSNVLEIDDSLISFLIIWKNYTIELNNLYNEGFEFHITFEFTITDFNFPAIVFEKEFIDFTSEHNISFGMYFWSGDDKYNEE